MSDSEEASVRLPIYAGEAWYEERPEPETDVVGRLTTRSGGGNPDGRAALAYTFHCPDGDYPVYAAGAEERLASLLGAVIEARGRLVDLRHEGGDIELWIATVTPVGPHR